MAQQPGRQPSGRLLAIGASVRREFLLDKPSVTIGSDDHNDFVIREDSVSREHAVLMWRGDGFEIRDMGSTNGTFVNGRGVSGPTPLANGDEVRFGAARFLLADVEQYLPAIGRANRWYGGLRPVAKSAALVALALIAGFLGGVVSTRIPAGTMKARQFVLVDNAGKVRAALAILPPPGSAPGACSICDGSPHLIVFDQADPKRMQLWPEAVGAQRTMSPVERQLLSKVLKKIFIHALLASGS
jgi:FHA domain